MVTKRCWPLTPHVPFPDLDPMTVTFDELYAVSVELVDSLPAFHQVEYLLTHYFHRALGDTGVLDVASAAVVVTEMIEQFWRLIRHPSPPDVWALMMLELDFGCGGDDALADLRYAYELAQERLAQYSPQALAAALALADKWQEPIDALYEIGDVAAK